LRSICSANCSAAVLPQPPLRCARPGAAPAGLRPAKLIAGQADLPDEARLLAVLSRVLILHPERLIAAGLLRPDGDSIVPTRAASYFYALHG
jgi:hypothetical protein